MAGVTLDTGALIAIERGDRRLQALLEESNAVGAHAVVTSDGDDLCELDSGLRLVAL